MRKELVVTVQADARHSDPLAKELCSADHSGDYAQEEQAGGDDDHGASLRSRRALAPLCQTGLH